MVDLISAAEQDLMINSITGVGSSLINAITVNNDTLAIADRVNSNDW
ncbi:MAG: hypothetical protein AAFQ80_12105 [Cyanobacteria bacterium J06621_8]